MSRRTCNNLKDLLPNEDDGDDDGYNEGYSERFPMSDVRRRYTGLGAEDRFWPLWTDIQDLIGPATAWPRSMRAFFWTRDIRHWPRIRMCAFAYINGLPPAMLLHWGEMMGCWTRDSRQSKHIVRLLRYFEDGRQYKLWAWNVLQGRCEWLDGTLRKY